MSWWIFIHFYLWQNSLRRWWEQPLSLFSKLVVAGLLGVFGAFVILGVKNLGLQLDRRLNNRDALTVIVTEVVDEYDAPGIIMSHEEEDLWVEFDEDRFVFLQTMAMAKLEGGQGASVVAFENLERQGLEDDFYVFSKDGSGNRTIEFEIKEQRSEARFHPSSRELSLVMGDRDILVGGRDRLSALLANGYTKTSIIFAKNLDQIQKIYDIKDVVLRVDGKKINVQSNLSLLLELQEVRSIQAQALVWVTVGASLILGLVFGSLAWMEFREERYLLSLIRTFGVGRLTLLTHSLLENCLLSVGGVLLGFTLLRVTVSQLNLVSLKMTWLRSVSGLYGHEGQLLLLGALVGGILSCVPVAIGLRKPLGLVMK